MDEAKNPWTVLSKSPAYENAWIRVDHHEVLNPAGGPGVYGVVHFKAHATGIVPIDEKGNVILVGQYRFPLCSYSWEVPEGGSFGETAVLKTAQRELQEECGIIARCWIEIQGMDMSNSVSDERGTIFLAWDLTHAKAEPEPTEQIEVAQVPFWEAIARIKSGEIRDSMSLVALLRVALMAEQGELPEPVARLIRR